MSTCPCCSNSKLFMKLTNGICENCNKEFSHYENDYKEILNKVKNPDIDPLSLCSEIMDLSIQLRKFDPVSKTLKSSDCSELITLVKSLIKEKKASNTEPLPNLDNEDLEVSSNTLLEDKPSLDSIVETTIPSNTINIPSTINTVPNISTNSYTNTNKLPTLTTLPKSDIVEDRTIDLSEHIVSTYIDDNLDELEDLSSDLTTESFSNVNSDSLNEELDVSTLSDTLEIIEDDTTEELEVSDSNEEIETIKPLTSEFIDEVTTILNSLKVEASTMEEKCYYIFILRDNYLPLLQAHNHIVINDTNIEELIDSTLMQASIIFKCPIDKLYSYFNYVSFGIQTTGLKVATNSIIELSAVKVQFGEVKEIFSTLINPLNSISLSTEKKTGITNESLMNAPTIDVALNKFLEFSKGLTLITHNLNYNYKFLAYHYEHIFRKPLDLDVACSLKLYRVRYKQFHGEPTKDSTLTTCCRDILEKKDLDYINQADSISLSCALGTYKLYEVIKSRYK